MKRALILGAALCGCSLRTPRITGAAACSSSTQCEHAQVCFLGECRVNASNLSVVRVEVRPPDNSPFGTMQVAIDLRASVANDFTLQPALSGTGTVSQNADTSGGSPTPVAGANIVFTDHAPAIPDRVEQVAAVSNSSGAYSARLPQGTWDVLVRPPPPLPPYRPPAPFLTTAPALDLQLPSKSSLRAVVAALTTSDGGPLAGASVTAVDDGGQPLSAPSLAQQDGGYSLLLPPATTTYLVQVGPPTDLDGGTAALALDPLPVYDQLVPGDAGVTVTLPPEVKLSGQVLDTTGAGIAAASVYARSEGMPWNLARSTTASDGGSYTLVLRAGSYVVEAAPSAAADAPAVSGEVPITLTADVPLDFVCPTKVHSYGLVVTPDGLSVAANYQVTATRLADKLLTARTAFTTPTGNDGIYHVIGDPGPYRFEIVPTPGSGLPRKIVQLDLVAAGSQETVLPTIQISRPLLAVGTVRGQPAGGTLAALGGATVSFYSLDAAGTHGVFLGSALTDSLGHYLAVVPDVAQPGP